jgi:hypothetical protein
MHGSLDKFGKNEDAIYQRWGIGLLVLPVLLAIVLAGLAIVQPAASNWIAETVQAEFTGIGVMPEVAPTQLGRPAMEMRTVQAH